MSKISDQAAEAFLNNYDYYNNNTSVESSTNPYLTVMILHGSAIAIKDIEGFRITNAGWPTVTTKSRLNRLPGVHINQRNGQWYLNGNVWDGSWITIY